ncbi:alcohol dehydrogenase [Betaproteobacteria bacterium GR16-43]|nr:alcohol dehydrogenase [Betaproteobacteria bacterium GR16-43]
MKELFDLQGKVAFIPGGYGGIGAAVAEALARAGASVAVGGRSLDKAQGLAAKLTSAGHRAMGVEVDAEDVESIRKATDAVALKFGRLDILANCVGKNQEQKVAEVTAETFDEIYRTNLRSAMFFAQAAAKHQVAGGRGGKQVHLLSVRSLLGMRGYGYSAYCATKGALVMLVKQHAVELASHGITVNGIAPTVVLTETARKWKSDPGRWEALLARIPLGRVCEPKDVAAAALYFCSPASDFATGQVLYLDGGISSTQ